MKFLHVQRLLRLLIPFPKSFSAKSCASMQERRRFSTSCARVLFLGSDEFSIGSLQALRELYDPESLTVVVSHSNNDVAKYSKLHSLKIIPWNDLKVETMEIGEEQKFDFGVVASFGYLIPEKIIRRCRMGILNVHASLLPNWRGASPISHAIMNGDTVTGISIMQITPHKFDVGPILLQKEISLHPHVRAPELKVMLTQVGGAALKEVLGNLDFYLTNSKPQNNLEGTLAPKVTQEMAQIRWDSKGALEIYNQYRGLCGFFKLRTNYQNRVVDLDDFAIHADKAQVKSTETNSSKLIDPSTDFRTFYDPAPVRVTPYALPKNPDVKPGDIYFSNNFLCVKCYSAEKESAQLNWIFIRKVKVGAKWMSALDFKNGFLTKSDGRKFFYDETESGCPNLNLKTSAL